MTQAAPFSFDPNDYNADPVEQDYRDALGDGLEAVLGSGAASLADLAAGLNARGVPSPRGGWTEDLLSSDCIRHD